MKPTRSTVISVFVILFCYIFSTLSSIQAQVDIREVYPRAIKEMKEQKWEEAQVLLEGITAEFADRGQGLFGVKFGNIYYQKGYCELKIASKLSQSKRAEDIKKSAIFYEQAKKSFSACRDILNNPNGALNNVQQSFLCKTLLYWGRSEQGLGNYNEAIALYKKFLKELDPRLVKYNAQNLQIDLAICYLKLERPNTPESLKHIEAARKDQ